MSTTTDLNTSQASQIVNQLISSWTAQNKAITEFFDKFEEEIYFSEVAPGRNRANYIFGHLIATSDGILPFINGTDRIFPFLEPVFLSGPDNADTKIPPISELKIYWQEINQALKEQFEKMSVSDWLEKHTKVSLEDFEKNVQRNKLSILISRTIHMGYHLGQLTFLSPRPVI